MRTATWRVVGVCLVVILGVAAVWTDVSSAADTDQVDDYFALHSVPLAFEKLGRGVTNTLGGWLEIPINMHRRYAEDDRAASLFTGFFYGVAKGVVRTGVGVYEAVTFFLPYPEHLTPILPTLEYFQSRRDRQPLPLEY